MTDYEGVASLGSLIAFAYEGLIVIPLLDTFGKLGIFALPG